MQPHSKCGKHPLKVLLLLHVVHWSGAPKIIIETFEALKDRIDVKVVAGKSFGGKMESRVRSLFPLLIYWSEATASLSAVGAFFATRIRRRLWRYQLKKWKPDVIYCNSVYSLVVLQQMNIPEIPVILHVHETDVLLDIAARQFPNSLQNVPDRYIAVTHNVRDRLTSAYGIPGDKITVIENYTRHTPSAERERSMRTDGAFVVGGAGFVSWYKGCGLWLQMAWELLRLMEPKNVKFVWVGVDDDEAGLQFRDMARKLGIEQYVEFIRPCENPLEHFVSFDVLAVSSWEESFSLVAVENMLLGTPVVCFANSGGTPEVVGDAGIVIDNFSPRLMAEAIAELSQSPERWKILSDAGRKRAVERFSDRQQIEKIYDEIMQATSGSKVAGHNA